MTTLTDIDNAECYGLSGTNANNIARVALRLFDDRTLTSDQRRDAAETLRLAIEELFELPDVLF